MGGLLFGEAQKLFISTAPGSKGAPSSQALAFCYANILSPISCLLSGQTSTSLRTSRELSSHFILNPLNTKHTHRQTITIILNVCTIQHFDIWNN
ncbi:unnamed protein product [Tetraodon nigroviridis]|uniref:(spotted green pufferfish) hypothetical protein n=1 Tax=Tetraodon nigroviridis TaxID=99883 RepID=Q4RUN0_TETNG|nr:unnamed protein product [Tetraodon nigroviridis]